MTGVVASTSGSGVTPDLSVHAAGAGHPLVERPRVMREITSRLERFGLVQLVASAGSGKTTALQQAARELELPTAWLTLDRWDRRPARFVDNLVEALADVVPGLRKLLARPAEGVTEPGELAALVGAALARRDLLVVIDDVHLLADAEDALGVLSTFLRRRRSGVRVALSGRSRLPLFGLGLDAVDPAVTLSGEILAADRGEAEQILRARGLTGDLDAALLATDGWVAGLVFESWRTAAGSGTEALAAYLENEVRTRLDPEADAFLLACSVFARIDSGRALALAGDDAARFVDALLSVGLPAAWDGTVLTLHPAVREALYRELETGPRSRLRELMSKAAKQYEQEGDVELALDAYVAAGDSDSAVALLSTAVVGMVDRGDIELVLKYLDEVRIDPEPPSVVLARLMLAFAGQRTSEGEDMVNRLLGSGGLPELIATEPLIGVYATHWLAGRGRIDEAAETLALIPPGRAADVGRLIMSLARDDPDAPVPDLAGGLVDAMILRALYLRGLAAAIPAEIDESLVAVTGPPTLSHPVASGETEPLGSVVGRLRRAIDYHDLAAATSCVNEMQARSAPIWAGLGRAECALRLRRDPAEARAAVTELRALPEARVTFWAEMADTWEGGALLLEDGSDDEAARILRSAVESMQRGRRTVLLAAALVYLAEAEWRLGHEEASDRLVDDAYGVAQGQGDLRELMLALADFPGSLARRLDLETASDSVWHQLGRSLTGMSQRRLPVPQSVVHVRQFGDSCLMVDGVPIRPKLRKSLELLSFLLSRREGRATRTEVLNALWAGRDDTSTGAYLRQALRHLRDALPESVTIEREGEELAVRGPITAEEVELQALVLEAGKETGSARLGLLLSTLSIARRGLFLEGSTEAPWVDDRRSDLESDLSDVRLDAAELLLERSRYLEALELVGEVLDRDRLLERGWRIRMRALGILGDDQGVLDSYRSCRSALAEIGLEPSRTTTKLAQSLRG